MKKYFLSAILSLLVATVFTLAVMMTLPTKLKPQHPSLKYGLNHTTSKVRPWMK